MRRNPQNELVGKPVSPFSLYLRTGYHVVPLAQNRYHLELKFNPHHDPKDGRFTFGPGGESSSVGGSRARPSRARRSVSERMDLKDPANYTVHTVTVGDTLAKIAARRRGVTSQDLAILNGIAVDAPLTIGQRIKLPTQDSRDAAREAKNRFLATEFYLETHNRQLPPPGINISSLEEQILGPSNWTHLRLNDYDFGLDAAGRTRQVEGPISLGATVA